MHQLPGGFWGPLWYQGFLRIRGKKRLVAISKALRAALGQEYKPVLPENQVVVAPSGVDLERFVDLPDPQTARKKLELPAGWTAVCTGHLYPGRGMEFVIELARHMPDDHFLWVGGDPRDVENWQSTLLQHQLQNLALTGFIPNQDLPYYQAAGDALLIPYERTFSNSGGEDISSVSSPMKIFEYMTSGRVIVSNDLPVLREILNEDNAILCPPGDVNAWVRALRKIQSDPGSGLKLAIQARQDVEKYSWVERSHSILLDFMDEIK